jgi:cellulose biosynthesis protein BcsQ
LRRRQARGHADGLPDPDRPVDDEPTRACGTEFGFDLLPANRELAGAEIDLIDIGQREYRLRDALAEIRGGYDFILLDCPPALNMLTVNGLVAADSVMIPMQCEYYALEGLTDLVATLKKYVLTSIRYSRLRACCGPCSTRVRR